MDVIFSPDNLRIVALGATSIFAGAALFISAVDAPVREQLPPAQARDSFQRFYPPSAKLQASMTTVAALSCASLAYSTDNNALYAAAAAMAGIVPFTVLLIKPMHNDPLLGTAKLTDAQIRQHLRGWRKMHLVRTVGSCLALGIIGYAT
ncbi:hypothetical protein RI367_007361 [Sorochytrium milnesiophthora]